MIDWTGIERGGCRVQENESLARICAREKIDLDKVQKKAFESAQYISREN